MTRPSADCEVWLNGEPAACTVDALKAGIPTILTDLQVNWGRQRPLDQPDIGTCTFAIRDEVATPDALSVAPVGTDVQVYSTGVVPVPEDSVIFNDGGWELSKPGALPTNRYLARQGSPTLAVVTTQHNTGQNSLAISGPTVVDAINGATNPSLEGAALGGYSTSTPARYPVTLDAAAAMSGTYSAVSTRTADTLNTFSCSTRVTGMADGSKFPVTAGVPVTVSIDIKTDASGRNCQANISWFDSGGGSLGTSGQVTVITGMVPGQVTRISRTATPPAGAVGGWWQVEVVAASGNVAAGEHVWLDRFKVGTDASYFDGDTPASGGYSYRWTGTPRASASQRLNGSREVLFPPRPFSKAGGDPTAWDSIPQMAPGETWPVSLWVKQLAGAKVTLLGAVAPTPYASGVSASTATAPEVTTTGVWQKITGTISNPLAGPAWPLLGVRLTTPLATAWQDQGTTTWADHPETWASYQKAYIDDLQVTGPKLASRRVLIFSGQVTDVVVSPVTDEVILLEVTAADIGAALENDAIGDDPWPVQSLLTRANTITSLAHLNVPVVIDTGLQAIQVSYRDVDAQPVLGLLQDLAQSVAATLWTATHGTAGSYFWMEDPDDRVSVRALTVSPESQLIIITGSTRNVSIISASDILRDPVRLSQTVNEIITTVDVTWLEQTLDDEGKPAPTERITTSTDAEAQDQYGRRRLGITTDLTTQADAADLGATILARSRRTGWRADRFSWDTGRVKDHLDTIDDGSRQVALMDLLDGGTRIGKALTLIDLPAWMPATVIDSMYVEGGTYSYRDGAWMLDLTISPAQGQGQSVTWQDIPADTSWQWQDWSPDLEWIDLYGVAGPTFTPGGI